LDWKSEKIFNSTHLRVILGCSFPQLHTLFVASLQFEEKK